MKRRSILNTICNQIDCLLKETNAGEKQEEVDQEQQGQSGGTVCEVTISLFKKQSFYKLTPNKILLNRTHIAWMIPRSKKMMVMRNGKTRVAKLLRR